ncbi:MAG: helix-turn-helix transcriptional regulator [Acidobacteria bacterium]|nr:helix-turn-helix transcriptional regulator [Acidobacteriota bacterium]
MTYLEFRRRALNWRQGYLANLCGVRQSDLSAFERGRLRPTPDVCARLADALGVPVTTLFLSVEAVGFRDADAEEAVR